MSLISKKILGINITIDKEDKILEKVRKYLLSSRLKVLGSSKKVIKPLVIFTPNPEIINYAQGDPIYNQIINTAQINLPDGAGIVWALKRIHNIKIKRISGADFVLKWVGEADEKTYTIGVIGGSSGLAIETSECLRKKFPGVKIEVLGEPEIKIKSGKCKVQSNKGKEINTEIYFQNLIKEIVERKIDILFVALGFPKQEYFINELKAINDKLKVRKPVVMMGVGGSLDYISERVRRAPEWMQRGLGSEWIYRLIVEPWRIKRHIIGSQFFLRVLWRKLLF